MVCTKGPGYATPQEAMLAPAEKLIYVPCLPVDDSKPDYLSTVDVDPKSETYCQVVHRLHMPNVGDELHHTGWNACSSCHDDASKARTKLILPGLLSSRVYVVDTSEERAPRLHHTVEPEELKALGVTHPHTSHCLGSGEIMIATLGDATGESKGNFLLLDGETFKPKGTWTETDTPYGYDFWYQPRLDVMLSTEFGNMNRIRNGFNPAEIGEHYGNKVHVWSWSQKKLLKSIDMGAELIPLEMRFLHQPDSAHAFVGTALGSSIVHFFKEGEEWVHEVVVKQEATDVEGWALPQMPPLITDVVIDLNDRFLYFGNWFRGDVCQYDISDPHAPKFVSRVWLGGLVKEGSPFKATAGLPTPDGKLPPRTQVKGVELRGGPQMLQLSLDGKRLYVTSSLFKPWDKQFYSDMGSQGSQMVQIDCEAEGMQINQNFLVDFGDEPDGPALAHEVRYPGGDCTSDIWL